MVFGKALLVHSMSPLDRTELRRAITTSHRRRSHGRHSARAASILGLSVIFAAVINPLSASAATHYYRHNSSLAYNVWANDTYGYSHANTAEAQASGSGVEVSNGMFTASGFARVQQTYAQSQVHAKCRWTSPSAWPSQNMTCWDSY